MNPGRLIAVVGASGVGKDSIMSGIIAARPDIRLVRRTITREAGLGGEDYQSVTPAWFAAAAEAGAFCVHWHAHGLRYGIPADVLADTQRGTDCLANLSRSALPDAQTVFPDLVVLNITASPDTLARRLQGRGRETQAEIAARLAQAEEPPPVLTRVPLRGLVDDVIENEVLAGGDAARVSFVNDVAPGLSVRADPEQLYRVLANLLRNARQALEATGRGGRIDVWAVEDDMACNIHVRDDGPGLPPKAREHLFTAFQGGVR